MVQKEKFAYLVGDGLIDNAELKLALQEFQLEPIPVTDPSNTAVFATLDLSTSIIIFDDFVGPLFDYLRRSNKVKIYGAPAIIANASMGEKKLPVLHSGYPIYCHHLRHCKVAATGLRSREHLHELRRLILYMDGIFLEKEAPLTHLVADKVRGDKYRDAVALGKPILRPAWIEFLWEKRNSLVELKTNIDEFKLKAFHKCSIAFEGFEAAEKDSMVNLVDVNGGFVVEPDNPEVTHIVKSLKETMSMSTPKTPRTSCTSQLHTPVRTLTLDQIDQIDEDVQSPTKRPRFEPSVINDLDEKVAETSRQKEYPSDKTKVMKVEWFWSSIQIEACAAESDYLFYQPVKPSEEFGNVSTGPFANSFTSPLNLPLSDTDGGTPSSPGGTPQSIGRRKRKRHLDIVSALAAIDCPHFIKEIPVDVQTANLGGNSLDRTPQDISDAEFATLLKQVTEYVNQKEAVNYMNMTVKHIEFTHLVKTERNYVGILMSVVKHFKEPCENENQAGGRILDPIEVKTIFGNILPIYALHRQLLRDLFAVLASWNEECLTGKVFCDHSKGFRKAYEPYVNFYEASVAEISRCETEKTRFMAFLRIAQGREECGKQTLSELMIRPIQRLPSIGLILINLKKHTKEANPDYNWITQALETMNGVNQGINEEKRVTESRIAMFDLYNEIEGFPAHLISAQRQLIIKLECISLNNLFGQKYDAITVLIFNDHIQLARRRGNNVGGSRSLAAATNASVANIRSPSLNRKSMMIGPPSTSHHHSSSKFKYKFEELIEFEKVKRVVEVTDVPGVGFSLIVRANQDVRERILVFNVLENGIDKWKRDTLVARIAQLIASHLQRMDYVNLIASADSTQLHVPESTSAIGKVLKFGEKSRKKLTRALSLSKTPNKFKRTVSQMMSPFSSSRRLPMDQDTSSSDFESTSTGSTTPLRPNFSAVSLWGFRSKRGTGDSTPKSRPALTESSGPNNIFESIEES